MALELSDAAAKHIRDLRTAQNLGNEVFLRVGIKGGGCSGRSYSLEFDAELGPHDKEFEIKGIKVVVDKKSYLFLNNATLDYATKGLTGGFVFTNPNVHPCGCGTSFSTAETKADPENNPPKKE